jgi:hypothetical protein
VALGGGAFLWLALRDFEPAVVASTLQQVNGHWLVVAIVLYLTSIDLRCVRWGALLRATDDVQWRHAAGALLTGVCGQLCAAGAESANYFRADYALVIGNHRC